MGEKPGRDQSKEEVPEEEQPGPSGAVGKGPEGGQQEVSNSFRIAAASERNDVVTVAITSPARAGYELALNCLSRYLHKSLQQPCKKG